MFVAAIDATRHAERRFLRFNDAVDAFCRSRQQMAASSFDFALSISENASHLQLEKCYAKPTVEMLANILQQHGTLSAASHQDAVKVIKALSAFHISDSLLVHRILEECLVLQSLPHESLQFLGHYASFLLLLSLTDQIEAFRVVKRNLFPYLDFLNGAIRASGLDCALSCELLRRCQDIMLAVSNSKPCIDFLKEMRVMQIFLRGAVAGPDEVTHCALQAAEELKTFMTISDAEFISTELATNGQSPLWTDPDILAQMRYFCQRTHQQLRTLAPCS